MVASVLSWWIDELEPAVENFAELLVLLQNKKKSADVVVD
jgi:hypothetical protein